MNNTAMHFFATDGTQMKHRFENALWRFIICVSSALICGYLSCFAAAGAPQPSLQQIEFFESRIRPVLAEHCWSCHGPKKQSGGVRLDSRKSILDDSDNGPIVVPGEPEKSALVRAIRQTGAIKMPPKNKLPTATIDALTEWIKMGAPWPEAKVAVAKSDDAWRKHWAFQPIRDPAIPPLPPLHKGGTAIDPPLTKGGQGGWVRTPIDAFILAE